MAVIATTITQPRPAAPHAWQTAAAARFVRRAGRHWVMSRHVGAYCKPLTVDGAQHLDALRGPLIIMPNHSSHMDTPVALSVLPERIRARTAVAAAADKFYRPGKRGWWYSLFYNAFPIERSGGSAALDYTASLIERGWSIVMYPEGTRSPDGEMARFHHGVSIVATRARVPVVPVHLTGLRNVMPKGERTPRPAAVHVRIGAPLLLSATESVPESTARLEWAMLELAASP